MLTTTLKKDYTDKPHEYLDCPLCGSHREYVLATKGYPGVPVRNVICRECGLIRINPRMTRVGYEDFYKEDFFEYLNPFGRPAYVDIFEQTTNENFITPVEKNVFPFLLPFVKEGGRLLDVGAGFGQVIYLLQKKKDVVAVGIEPDPYSRKIALEKIGITLLDITIEDFLKTNTQKFDCIFLDQVFEHLLEPLSILRSLGEALSDDGIIYVGVPNSYNPGVSMDRYYELAHTFGYTPAVMNLFAKKANLKIVSLRDPFGHALEVIFAKKDSPHPEETRPYLGYGSSWVVTTLRLRRKEFLNFARGKSKIILSKIFGLEFTEKLRNYIDRIFRYRY